GGAQGRYFHRMVVVYVYCHCTWFGWFFCLLGDWYVQASVTTYRINRSTNWFISYVTTIYWFANWTCDVDKMDKRCRNRRELSSHIYRTIYYIFIFTTQ